MTLKECLLSYLPKAMCQQCTPHAWNVKWIKYWRRGWCVMPKRKCQKGNLHWPGIEPGPPAWQARILPLNQRCSADSIKLRNCKACPNTSANNLIIDKHFKNQSSFTAVLSICQSKKLQRPGIEPGPPAWQARILPLNHRCFSISEEN